MYLFFDIDSSQALKKRFKLATVLSFYRYKILRIEHGSLGVKPDALFNAFLQIYIICIIYQ